MQIITKYWYLIVNLAAIAFAVIDTLLELGILKEYPAAFGGIVGFLNLIAEALGLQPVVPNQVENQRLKKD